MKSKHPTHALFICRDCDRKWENHITADKSARLHANNTGHRVTGEVAFSVWYGKGKSPENSEAK